MAASAIIFLRYFWEQVLCHTHLHLSRLTAVALGIPGSLLGIFLVSENDVTTWLASVPSHNQLSPPPLNCSEQIMSCRVVGDMELYLGWGGW